MKISIIEGYWPDETENKQIINKTLLPNMTL